MSKKTDIVIEKMKATGRFDIDTGVEYCGTLDDYVDILEQCPFTFQSSLDKVEEYFANGLSKADEKNFTEYRVQAHSIKSTARLLGLGDLFEIAKTSEFAVREENEEKAISNHPVMVEATKDAIRLIEGFFEGIDEAGEGESCDEDIVTVLKAIYEAAEDFDVDAMDDGIKKIKCMSIPPSVQERKQDLIAAVANIDSDEVMEIIDEMLEGI